MNENHEHEFPDELLSAYLDGELAPADKARVEEQLMDSAEHRRLFEELKSLRRSLQSLPAEKLGDDFAARVLRRAERELLAEAPPVESLPVEKLLSEKAPAKETIVADEVGVRPSLVESDRGLRRGLFWSIVATAAAVGLVVFGPLLNDNSRNISLRGPVLEKTEEKNTEEAATPTAPAGGAAKPDDIVGAKKSGEGEMAAPAKGAAQDKPKNANRAIESPLAATSPAEAPQRDADALAAPAPAAPLKEQQAELSSPASVPHNNAVARGGAGAGAAAGPQADVKDRNIAGDKYQPAAEKAATDKIAAVDALGKANPVVTGSHNTRSGGKPSDGEAAAATAVVMKSGRSELQAAAAPAFVKLVTLDVTPAALSTRFFDEVLKRHGVAMEVASAAPFGDIERDDSANEDSVNNDSADEAAPLDSPTNRTRSGEDGGAAFRADLEGDGLQGGKLNEEQLQRKAAQMQGDVDVVVVDATQSQIDELLRDLHSRQGEEVLAMVADHGGWRQQLAQGGLGEEARQLGQARGGVDQLADAAENKQFGGAAPAAELESAGGAALEPQVGLRAATPSPVAEEEAADLKADASGAAFDAQRGNENASGIARRLSLPAREVAQFERQFRRASEPGQALSAAKQEDAVREGGARGGDALDDAAPKIVVKNAAPAEAAPPSINAEGAGAEGEDAPAPPSAPSAEPQASPAPQANGYSLSDARDVRRELAKSKAQPLVRVLFVLRAQATAAPHAAAAEALEAPVDAAKPEATPAPQP